MAPDMHTHPTGGNNMSSGYVHCACRDCFDVAISGDDNTDVLCPECEEAGCEAHDSECCRSDAYGFDDEARS
jgi:hypothetical protein